MTSPASTSTPVSPEDSDLLPLLERWEASLTEMELAWARLQSVTGSCPESRLGNAIFALMAEYTATLSALIGDNDNWLEWHRSENAFGAKSFEAGYDKKTQPIRTLHDLAGLIND